VGDQLVTGECIEGPLAVFAFRDHFHHARKPFAVEVEENSDHFGGFGPCGRVFEGFYLPEQRLHPGDPFL
jgi:hypothetical protein